MLLVSIVCKQGTHNEIHVRTSFGLLHKRWKAIAKCCPAIALSSLALSVRRERLSRLHKRRFPRSSVWIIRRSKLTCVRRISTAAYLPPVARLQRIFTTLEGIRETTRTLFGSTLYNSAMNKRARKRLKEAIEKKNLERQKMLKEQSSTSSQTKERRGFTVKPEKKRG